MPAERFPLRLADVSGHNRGGSTMAPRDALVGVLGREAVAAAEALLAAATPRNPPVLEAEAAAGTPDGGEAPAAAINAWRAEAARQAATPFRAGRAAATSFQWKNRPPRTLEGEVWKWGPTVDPAALSADDRVMWAKLLLKELGTGALRMVTGADVDVVTPGVPRAPPGVAQGAPRARPAPL